MFCNMEEFVFMRWDFEEQNRFHQGKIKHLILEASESKWTQMTCYCSRKRGSHCDECESKRPGQKPQTKRMFVWHFPGPGHHCFSNSALAGTSHISTQLNSKTGGFCSWLRSQVPCQGETPPYSPTIGGQHPNAEVHPSGPSPSWLKKEGLDPRSSRNSSHSSSLEAMKNTTGVQKQENSSDF